MKKLFFLVGIVFWSLVLSYSLGAAPDDQKPDSIPVIDPQDRPDSIQQKIKTPESQENNKDIKNPALIKPMDPPEEEPEECDC